MAEKDFSHPFEMTDRESGNVSNGRGGFLVNVSGRWQNLRKPRKFFGIAVHAFSQTELGKRSSPGGEQPTNSTADHGTASVMPAWTAGTQARRDASGDIHVNLGSGTPCRNDDIEEFSPKLTRFERGE
jgi:hypothetical protein